MDIDLNILFNFPCYRTKISGKQIETEGIVLPITEQNQAKITLDKLREHFTINNIPEYFLQLPPLPEPTWDIFSDAPVNVQFQ